MIHALKATAMWLADAVIYLAAFLCCTVVLIILMCWNMHGTAWLPTALLIPLGAIAWPALDNWMSDFVLHVTGSHRAMPLVAMLFAVIFGAGMAQVTHPSWHGMALSLIGFIGVASLHEWILPPLRAGHEE